MKKVLLLFVLTTLISCNEIRYDGERRLVFKTIILNAQGEPLPNSYVEISIVASFSSDLISRGKTNNSGELTLIFPSPESDHDINLMIYNDDATYLKKEVVGIKKSDFVNYKLNYQTSYLLKSDEVAPLNLTYNQTSNANILKKVSIEGIYHLDTEYFNYPDTNYYLFPSQFLIKKNQQFQLKYKVKNLQSAIETDYAVDLQIGNEALNYTLNY